MKTTTITLNNQRVTVPEKRNCIKCKFLDREPNLIFSGFLWKCKAKRGNMGMAHNHIRPHAECIRARKRAEGASSCVTRKQGG